MTAKAHFKQEDVKRALKAALAAELKPSCCTIDPSGSIKLEFFDEAAPARGNPLDRVLKQ